MRVKIDTTRRVCKWQDSNACTINAQIRGILIGKVKEKWSKKEDEKSPSRIMAINVFLKRTVNINLMVEFSIDSRVP